MPMIDIEATGKNIRGMMTERDMTVRDVQQIFGFSSGQAVYKWVWGKSLPTIDNLVVLANVFKVKIDDILVII